MCSMSRSTLPCNFEVNPITHFDQNCSILSQKVLKFELYKHNDELFNIYYGIFYELWTFADLTDYAI